MEIGQTHKFGTRYLANYANEAAYREDTRRLSNGEIFRDILSKCDWTKSADTYGASPFGHAPYEGSRCLVGCNARWRLHRIAQKRKLASSIRYHQSSLPPVY